MTFGRLAWLVGVALLVLVVNVTVSILYMVAYGHLIDPGHEEQYYHDTSGWPRLTVALSPASL